MNSDELTPVRTVKTFTKAASAGFSKRKAAIGMDLVMGRSTFTRTSNTPSEVNYQSVYLVGLKLKIPLVKIWNFVFVTCLILVSY